jgi:hypothetical protein
MKGSDSPIIKYGLIALVVLAIVFAIMKFTGGGSDGPDQGLGETPKPTHEPVDGIPPESVIGIELGGGK